VAAFITSAGPSTVSRTRCPAGRWVYRRRGCTSGSALIRRHGGPGATGSLTASRGCTRAAARPGQASPGGGHRAGHGAPSPTRQVELDARPCPGRSSSGLTPLRGLSLDNACAPAVSWNVGRRRPPTRSPNTSLHSFRGPRVSLSRRRSSAVCTFARVAGRNARGR